ncbi:DUF86 domain-containing protein [Paraburkholderia pallida]|uniref:DUF86 domain-containing protein n=1 Tax=Paraburkholderia pallida TaxID=2547399 RepID=A0A4V1AZ61_9BURK|nr:DUF86 domain-containing protein [Paraburkholderia pallida]QBQ98152.1 DUF86 domain-containing protein [Paraburkholderia pallida]
MKKGDLRTRDYIEHILTAIERIRDYTASVTLETFQTTPMVIDAVVRNLEIIGEAARNVIQDDPTFIAAHPEIPWQAMYATRNRVSHGYFDIDTRTVWVTVQNDLPELERALLPLKQS